MTVGPFMQVSTPLACLCACCLFVGLGAGMLLVGIQEVALMHRASAKCISSRHESMRRESTSRAKPIDTNENIEPSAMQASLSPTHKSTTSCFEKDIRANGCARSIDRWIAILQATKQLVARKNHSHLYVCVCVCIQNFPQASASFAAAHYPAPPPPPRKILSRVST